MIKQAKVGDVIFHLNYNIKHKTCNINKHIVSLDQRKGDYVWVNDNNKLLRPEDSFKTYKQAYKTYISRLKSELKYANKVVDLITNLLSRIEEKGESMYKLGRRKALEAKKSKNCRDIPPGFDPDIDSLYPGSRRGNS